MLDEFLWGRVSRISPEAPVPVVQVTRPELPPRRRRQRGRQRALAGRRGRPRRSGGRDAAGERVRESLAAAGVVSCLVALGDERPTTVKTRVVAHGQQVVRADREDTADVPAGAETALVESVRRELPSCGALVVSDYQKGVVTASLLKRVLPLAKRRGVPVLVDPKVRHFRLVPGRFGRDPEPARGRAGDRAAAAQPRGGGRGRAPHPLAPRLPGGARDARRARHEPLREGRRPLHVPTAAREVFDVTGAGDSVIATMALALAAGATLAEAAVLANCTAGVVVGKVGTAQASPAEVLAAARVAAQPPLAP